MNQPATNPQYLDRLTAIYQTRGLLEALRKLTPPSASFLFRRGLITLQVHPVAALSGKTDGRLLQLSDGHETVTFGVVLDEPDAGILIIETDTKSAKLLDTSFAPPEAVEGEIDRLLLGLVQQFEARWPPTLELQTVAFSRMESQA